MAAPDWCCPAFDIITRRWTAQAIHDGLKGSQIPLTARVLQIVDIYDALTTARPDTQALTPATALSVRESEVKKSWRDPDVFRQFASLVDEGEKSDPLTMAAAN